VPPSIGLAHTIRQHDGTSSGAWGPFALDSAFQPIFALREGKLTIAAFEGLIRPSRDGKGWSPAAFFGSIPAADRLHVETLARTLHLLNAAACLPPHVSIFLNFDPSLFSDRAVIGSTMREMRLVLHETGIDPRRVVCEVTEKKSASDDTLFELAEALRAGGFRIAVDDYGAEDSDMSRVRGLRPDIVKFDARWLTRPMESGPGFALLAAMVSTFAEQAVRTVFEGIEEGWQLDLAVRSGASMVQGYVLARPELASDWVARSDVPAAAARLPGPDAELSGPVAERRRPRPSTTFGKRLAS